MATIKKLLEGYQAFRADYYEQNRELFQRLVAEGQSPKTLVVGCSDSRVDPAILLDADPGDLFVVRNVANLVPPCETTKTYHGTSAALQFAVAKLKVENIIILGHRHCGGIAALVNGFDGDDEGAEFIGPWVGMAARARDAVLARWPRAGREQQIEVCERAAILVSLRNLRSFPFVRRRLEEGSLRLFGWYFDIDRGVLLQYDQVKRRFDDLDFNFDWS